MTQERELARRPQAQKFVRILVVIATTVLVTYNFGLVPGLLAGILAVLVFIYEAR